MYELFNGSVINSGLVTLNDRVHGGEGSGSLMTGTLAAFA
jgi:hypothetical protein